MPTDALEIVRAIYDAYARRDFAAAFESFSPELTFAQTPELPWGGQYQGVAGAQESFQKLIAHVDSRVEVEELVRAGDRVVAIGRTRGTVRGNGAVFDLRAVHIWQIVDGRVVRFEAYIDTPGMLAALAG